MASHYTTQAVLTPFMTAVVFCREGLQSHKYLYFLVAAKNFDIHRLNKSGILIVRIY